MLILNCTKGQAPAQPANMTSKRGGLRAPKLGCRSPNIREPWVAAIRALIGEARAIASFPAITRSRSSPPNGEGCSASRHFSRCGPSNLKVGRSQCIGRLPRPRMVEQAKPPTSDQPSPKANDDARPTAGALSLDCALSPPFSRPRPLVSGEFLASRELIY